jgi:LAGLIDADG DNA endonuclease family protein
MNVGSFLSGFALGEGSFMVVARRRGDYTKKWKLSAAFNVSQKDRVPLDLFLETLKCGSIRKAGNGGWYWEVNHLTDIQTRVVPFFEQFPLIGTKAEDFEKFRAAARILAKPVLSYQDYAKVLALREGMNGGGKRRYTMQRILRDYTPSSPVRAG